MEYLVCYLIALYTNHRYKWSVPLSRPFKHAWIKRRLKRQWKRDRVFLYRQWEKEAMDDE